MQFERETHPHQMLLRPVFDEAMVPGPIASSPPPPTHHPTPSAYSGRSRGRHQCQMLRPVPMSMLVFDVALMLDPGHVRSPTHRAGTVLCHVTPVRLQWKFERVTHQKLLCSMFDVVLAPDLVTSPTHEHMMRVSCKNHSALAGKIE